MVVRNPAGSVTSQVWQVSVILQGESTAWGDNTDGQSAMHRAETSLVALAAGGYHSVGLRENGTVLAWGDNYFGQTKAFLKPATTGDYVFFMASDDHGELYLSTDADPANKHMIAQEPVWGGRNYYAGDGVANNSATRGADGALSNTTGKALTAARGTVVSLGVTGCGNYHRLAIRGGE